MAVKQWSVGDVLAAADMNAWTVPLASVKPSDTGRANTTSVTADPDLRVTVAAGASYEIRCIVRYKGGANGSSDMQCTITVPASSSGFFVLNRINISGLAVGFDDGNFGTAKNVATNGTGTTMQLLIAASLTTTNSGTVAFAWGQAQSSGTATTVIAGSTITAQRIG